MRGRGAKHFFPSGSVSEENLPEPLFLSHTLPHVSSKTTDLASKLPPGTVNYEHVAFLKHFAKSRKIRVRKRSQNRLIVLVSFINGDPLSDRSKSKVQTTSRQEPRPCLQILFAKINYFPKYEERRNNISFSSLPDGKSASRNYERKSGTKCFMID